MGPLYFSVLQISEPAGVGYGTAHGMARHSWSSFHNSLGWLFSPPLSQESAPIRFGPNRSSACAHLQCDTGLRLMDSPAKEGQPSAKKKGKKTKKLGGSGSSGRGKDGPRLAEALADDNSTNGELAGTPSKSSKSAKGGKSATPAEAPAEAPAAPPKPVFQGTIGFLAPEKAMCRCVESPLVRGMRLNVSRIVLAFWTAEAKKSIKVKAALKKMTPEGRAQSGAFRAWYIKLLEHRRMKACAAKMSPEGRAKGTSFAKWINDQREKKKRLKKLQKIAKKISPNGMALRGAICCWLDTAAEARKMKRAMKRMMNRALAGAYTTWAADIMGQRGLGTQHQLARSTQPAARSQQLQ